MTPQQAKEILLLYRPGTADTEDPDLAAALQLCEQDPDLKRWFEEYVAVNATIKSRFHAIAIPEGLKEQILAERPRPIEKSHRKAALAGALAIVALALLISVHWPAPREDIGLAGFQNQMVSKALRTYGMDLESDNLQQIRAFLAERKAVADYELPAGLSSARPTGCVATTWQGKPVSMICFQSGKPLSTGQSSDLWLFVTKASSIHNAPRTGRREFGSVNTATVACWTEKGLTYVLAIDGNAEALKKFL